MARIVLLEFADGDEHNADALVESITEYSLGILIINGLDSTQQLVEPTVVGVYSEIMTIEGKSVE